MESTQSPSPTWFNKSTSTQITINVETVLFTILIILAFISRFYNLGDRVMSHDENSHVYFSWNLEQGKGYKHDPITHGPLQFHLIAFSYFMFGDNDFTARIPSALFSVATIAFMFCYRRFLGRAGSLVAALMLLISPYILYYGRYARNEAFVGLFGVLMIWAILQYYESGNSRYLIWLTIANVLHFTSKETSFIYTAQALFFLGIIFLISIFNKEWKSPRSKRTFYILVAIGLSMALIGAVLELYKPGVFSPVNMDITPVIPGEELINSGNGIIQSIPIIILLSGIMLLLSSIYFLIHGFTFALLRQERSYAMIVVLFSVVLPMLAPFPVRLLGYNPIDYQATSTIILHFIFVPLLFLIAILLGVTWNPRLWLINAGIFYGVFILFYTTFFSHGFGFITGLVGSLGYWLEQQGVNRGSQPSYYYWLLQIPLYEYLPALGVIPAIIFKINRILQKLPSTSSITLENDHSNQNPQKLDNLTFSLLLFWSITSLLAFTVAGEKMPWLTFHIALPIILLSAWFIGKIFEDIDWSLYTNKNGVLAGLSIPVFFVALSVTLGSLLGDNPPFQGKELFQLEATSTFLSGLIGMLVVGGLWKRWVTNWSWQQVTNLFILTTFILGAFLTSRTSYQAAYINYDDATEYLVYAHSAGGVKVALDQIEKISKRTVGGLNIRVAYDNATTYPYWWYLRNYPNQIYYAENPTRELREAPIILVGEENYGKIEPVVGQAYYQFDHIRIWWPNQDYYGLTWQRVFDAVSNPQMRAALFRIWFYRDYSLYGQVTNKDMSLNNWIPSSRMRMYIRKDVVNKLWNYGTAISEEVIVADPYEGKQITISADLILGTPGIEEGQFQRPRDIAIAPDGTIYIADTDNHRIQHLDREGNVLHVWGEFGDITTGNAPGGTFNQPWGIALAPDGSVYVTDTWNHRIQKFSAEGKFLSMWGVFGQAETPESFWGPRDVYVDEFGMVFITDTGNKRFVVFDPDGKFISEFGSTGMAIGQFDEPVGITIARDGVIFIADTWNQRIQTFIRTEDNINFIPLANWDIAGWYGQSLDNKPYLAAGDEYLYVVDPEGYRILQFSLQGDFIQYWGDYSSGPDGFGLPGSIAIDPLGGVWVSDAGNSRLMHFSLP